MVAARHGRCRRGRARRPRRAARAAGRRPAGGPRRRRPRCATAGWPSRRPRRQCRSIDLAGQHADGGLGGAVVVEEAAARRLGHQALDPARRRALPAQDHGLARQHGSGGVGQRGEMGRDDLQDVDRFGDHGLGEGLPVEQRLARQDVQAAARAQGREDHGVAEVGADRRHQGEAAGLEAEVAQHAGHVSSPARGARPRPPWGGRSSRRCRSRRPGRRGRRRPAPVVATGSQSSTWRTGHVGAGSAPRRRALGEHSGGAGVGPACRPGGSRGWPGSIGR